MLFLIWSKQWTEVAEEPRVKAVEVGKDRKFYSQCCINMFFTVELICTSSICHDLDFDFRTIRFDLGFDNHAHKLVMFILLLLLDQANWPHFIFYYFLCFFIFVFLLCFFGCTVYALGFSALSFSFFNFQPY